MTLDPIPTPVAILPVAHWDRPSQEALRFATSLTKDVQVLHVRCDQDAEVPDDWQDRLDAASRVCGVPAPEVITLDSPYRMITAPIVKHVLQIEAEHPKRPIAVVVPELVAAKWWSGVQNVFSTWQTMHRACTKAVGDVECGSTV